MSLFKNKGNKKIILGLIHLKPLPGTPLFKEGNFEAALEKAIQDARALYNGGATGCLVQTVDKIYPADDDADYARVSAMAIITYEVRKATGADFHVGSQIMWNCITPSLGVCKAAGATFTRTTALTGTTTSPFGMISANPLKVANYRKLIGAEDVEIIAEIAGYHFHGLGETQSLADKARFAINVGADAVEIMHNDEAVNNQMVREIKAAIPSIPVILGGKTDTENVKRRLAEADGALVGSCFENKSWGGNIDERIVQEYMNEVRKLEQ